MEMLWNIETLNPDKQQYPKISMNHAQNEKQILANIVLVILWGYTKYHTNCGWGILYPND